EIVAHQYLCDLHGVERGALAQVVGDHPEAEAVRHRGIPANPAHEDRVLARRFLRGHVTLVDAMVEHADARRLLERGARLLDRNRLSNSTLMASAWPMNTGTRTQ